MCNTASGRFVGALRNDAAMIPLRLLRWFEYYKLEMELEWFYYNNRVDLDTIRSNLSCNDSNTTAALIWTIRPREWASMIRYKFPRSFGHYNLGMELRWLYYNHYVDLNTIVSELCCNANSNFANVWTNVQFKSESGLRLSHYRAPPNVYFSKDVLCDHYL